MAETTNNDGASNIGDNAAKDISHDEFLGDLREVLIKTIAIEHICFKIFFFIKKISMFVDCVYENREQHFARSI